MTTRIILIFLFSIPFIGRTQDKSAASNDSVVYYKQDQTAYYFDIEGKNQKLVLDSVMYDNYHPLTVFIRNNTANLIEVNPNYHANTFWKHNNKLSIEPGAYFEAKLVISNPEKYKRISPLIGYLKIEYWEPSNPEHKKFQLALTGKVGLR